MGFFNCGAYAPNGSRVKTKKQLKELLKENPHGVFFDGTGVFDEAGGYKGDEIPEGVTLSVVLPDPYKDRRSYATVKRNGEALKVS